jgi:hypothetical protein
VINITVQDKTPELLAKVEAAINRWTGAAAAYVEGQIKSSMAESKSGAVYRRKGGEKHQASAPGESPAVDSGNLVNSVAIERATLEARIGTPTEYARYLEDGTGRMEARPVWERTARESLPVLEQMLGNAIGGIRS